MAGRLLSVKLVKVRKNHTCFVCARQINRGESVWYAAGLALGEFTYGYFCSSRCLDKENISWEDCS